MASGIDTRWLAIKESVYGTRVVPTRSFETTDDNIDYNFNEYASVSIGGGPWRRRRVANNTQSGSGTLPMEAYSVGLGFWLDGLHNNTVTPVQQGASAAYLQTHSLSSAPAKSYTIQKQTPPVSTSTLQAQDFTGCILSGAEFSIDDAGVLLFTPSVVAQGYDNTQSLATWTAPTTGNLYSFKNGSIKIGGSTVADIVGGATATLAWPLRDDAYGLGGSGKIRKPVPTDRPSFTGTFTADFEDFSHVNRTLNGTIADVVLSFRGATTPIASTYYEDLIITIPDCSFNTSPPVVGGPGPVQQQVAFNNASSAANVPSITYTSTDTVV